MSRKIAERTREAVPHGKKRPVRKQTSAPSRMRDIEIPEEVLEKLKALPGKTPNVPFDADDDL